MRSVSGAMATALYRIQGHSWSGADKRTIQALVDRELLKEVPGGFELTPAGLSYLAGKRMRYIAYFNQPMFPGSDPEEFASLEDLREGFRDYCLGVGIDECSGSVYGWSVEAWNSANEYAGVGVPFDYPWYLIERGPRGGVMITNA